MTGFDEQMAGEALVAITEWAENIVDFSCRPWIGMTEVHTMRASVEFLTRALDDLEHEVTTLEAELN